MNLKELRQKKGITQIEMAVKLDMSYQNYVNYERSKYVSMTKELENKISEILGVQYTYTR